MVSVSSLVLRPEWAVVLLAGMSFDLARCLHGILVACVTSGILGTCMVCGKEGASAGVMGQHMVTRRRGALEAKLGGL